MVGTIVYTIVGASMGIAQQRIGMAAGHIDCEYRVTLIRDRVVALLERSPQQAADDPQESIVSTLIRETHKACAQTDAESTRKLEIIDAQLREHQRVRANRGQCPPDHSRALGFPPMAHTPQSGDPTGSPNPSNSSESSTETT